MCATSTNVCVVDRQNHRIQIFDSAGNFVLSFGSQGFGDDNFNFPEGIATDGLFLYITDTGNHRIKKHTLTGTFVSEFGIRGSADGEFDYPMDVAVDSTSIYVADRQNHRVQIFTLAGAFSSKFGTAGTGNDNFKFPEGITIINNLLVVVDTANKVVKFFDLLGVFQYKTNVSFEYPVGVSNTDDVLTVVDRQGHKLYFFDEFANLLTEFGSQGTGNSQFSFPVDAAFLNDQLYVTDSASHRIKIFNFVVDDGLTFKDTILKLTKELYPTGRAWWMNVLGIFDKFHDALASSESRAYSEALRVQSSFIPDNTSFTTEDAANWERNLGLITNEAVELADRKAVIFRKMAFPGNQLARQHYLFIEKQIREAGFDVFVHENRFVSPALLDEQFGLSEFGIWEFGGQVANPNAHEVIDPLTLSTTIDWQFGLSEFGEWEFGGEATGIGFTEIIANYIDPSKDDSFFDNIPQTQFGQIEFGVWEFGSSASYLDGLKATFFVGGPGFPGMASIDINRRKEFRDLILKIKPAQTVGFLFINYI